LINDVLDEPLNGAHRNKKASAYIVKDYFLKSLEELQALSTEEMLERRYQQVTAIGAFSE